MGDLSIQRAAAQILEKYYVDFPIYNPYLDMLPGTRGKKGFKVYDVDGVGNGAINVSVYSRFQKNCNDLKITTLGREPVSIVHYTRPGSSIKRPTQN